MVPGDSVSKICIRVAGMAGGTTSESSIGPPERLLDCLFEHVWISQLAMSSPKLGLRCSGRDYEGNKAFQIGKDQQDGQPGRV
jgi:hypothetical protein